MIGIGVDLCEVDRMRMALGAHADACGRRVFTDDEQAYCDRRKDPTERYAARFAAKEAVMKAMGVGVGACTGLAPQHVADGGFLHRCRPAGCAGTRRSIHASLKTFDR